MNNLLIQNNDLLIQANEQHSQINTSISQLNSKSIAMVAQWSMVDGKLVCKWMLDR
jgi:hypothetical protein